MIASVDDKRVTILGLLTVEYAAGLRSGRLCPVPLRIAGRELSDAIMDEAVFDGTLSDMLRRVEEKLGSHNRRQIDLVSGERERRIEVYPFTALQQLVRNAIMHRDYEATNAPVASPGSTTG